MRAILKVPTSVLMAGLLLLAVPAASAQKPKSMPAQPPPPAPMAQQPAQQQVVVVEPIRVFDPFFTIRIHMRIRRTTWRPTSDT
jgi:hypothetical protein